MFNIVGQICQVKLNQNEASCHYNNARRGHAKLGQIKVTKSGKALQVKDEVKTRSGQFKGQTE
jgi:hypothetical protein